MNLRQQWLSLKEEQPHLRIRDAATLLGTSELQLLATDCGTPACVRLDAPVRTLLEALPPLGPLMALTRSTHAVHEKTGPYAGLRFMGAHMALAVGEHIDLRMFLSHWRHAFAVTVPSRRGPLASLQFFDAHGEAVHKVYATEETDKDAWQALIASHRATDQSPEQGVLPPSPAAASAAEGPLADRTTFLADWGQLRDTHDFFSLLRRHRISRREALLAAEGVFTTRLVPESVGRLLHGAAETGQPIMVFVHNHGCVQIHTGPIHRIVELPDWINIMDPGFNLHLRQSGVAEVWCVRKPTDDGDVTSIELLDAEERLMVQLFGARKPGVPEREDWRALAGRLLTPDAVSAQPPQDSTH